MGLRRVVGSNLVGVHPPKCFLDDSALLLPQRQLLTINCGPLRHVPTDKFVAFPHQAESSPLAGLAKNSSLFVGLRQLL